MSPVVAFAKALAIDGLAEIHQSSAALLPQLLLTMRDENPLRYARLQEMMMDTDPMEVIRDWITLSDPQEKDHMLETLCGSCYHLFEDPHILMEIKPLIKSLNETLLRQKNDQRGVDHEQH